MPIKKIPPVFFENELNSWKKEPQGIVEVQISYQMQKKQCSTFKIATCETLLKKYQNFEFFLNNAS